MIYDKITNWQKYNFGKAWEKSFAFILKTSPSIATGEYPIDGKNIFARVAEYQTKNLADGICETHRDYIDIQLVLKGTEQIHGFESSRLKVKTAYDAGKDAQFYHPVENPDCIMELKEGYFCAFMPQDAHMPSLTSGSTQSSVKKMVIKLRASLI